MSDVDKAVECQLGFSTMVDLLAQWSTTSETGPWTDISAYHTDSTVATNVAVDDSVDFWLRIQTPISTSS